MSQARKQLRPAAALLMAFVLAALIGCGNGETRVTTDQQPSPASEDAATANEQPSSATETTFTSWSFDDVAAGELPDGWNVEATNSKGPLATWAVVENRSLSSSNCVLVMSSPNHTFGGTFNICWTDKVSFLDGEIEVRFMAIKGEEDQGGGVIWRALDRDNYYRLICPIRIKLKYLILRILLPLNSPLLII